MTNDIQFDEEFGTNKGAEASTSQSSSLKPTTKALVVVEKIMRSDLQPSYAYEIDIPRDGIYGGFMNGMGNCCGALGSVPIFCCFPNPYKEIKQGTVGLISRFGQFYKAVNPGLVKVNPISETIVPVDVKVKMSEIPRQMCITKDNVNFHLTSVLYYHIVAPHKAIFGVDNVNEALVERTQTTLRDVVGSRTLQDVIERREEVASSIRNIIDETAIGWGVRVESILIKDLCLSGDLQESLSMAAKSKRIGESKIIAARAEVESAKLMRKAADILASKAAMQIRYLDAMQAMAKSAGSKVIFMPSSSAMENIADKVQNGKSKAELEDNYDDPVTTKILALQ